MFYYVYIENNIIIIDNNSKRFLAVYAIGRFNQEKQKTMSLTYGRLE